VGGPGAPPRAAAFFARSVLVNVTEILTLISATTAAIIAIIHAVKAPKFRAQVAETYLQVGELGKQLNGRLAELLEATRQAAWHAGLLEGQRLAHEPRKLPAFQEPQPPQD